jgi:acetoacetyl-CoA synthetase
LDDPDGAKYHAAYYDKYPGIWCHGDYLSETPTGGYIVYGRSDATLNPGGVRIGTAEIYRQVEQLDWVVESISVGQELPDGDTRIVLFVVLRAGVALDEPRIAEIKAQIRTNTTPRHVPAVVAQVEDIPRTKSGKITEVAVREIIHSRPIKNVRSSSSADAGGRLLSLRLGPFVHYGAGAC